MMQASKKIPFEDPNVLLGVRALYIVSNLIIAGIYIYVGTVIDKKKGKTLSHSAKPKEEEEEEEEEEERILS